MSLPSKGVLDRASLALLEGATRFPRLHKIGDQMTYTIHLLLLYVDFYSLEDVSGGSGGALD